MLVMLGLQRDRVPEVKACLSCQKVSPHSISTSHGAEISAIQRSSSLSSPDKTAGASLLAAALALLCESDASRRNFFAGGGATGSVSADVDVASVAGVSTATK